MSELKQRKPTEEGTVPTRRASKIDAAVDIASAYVPENVAVHLKKATPALKAIAAMATFLAPYVMKFYELLLKGWEMLQPYHPEEFAPALAGLVVAFFGGHFMTTIAAVEAFRLSGWERTRTCIESLYEDYKLVAAANAKDDERDDDGDGVADVEQISTQELAQRKMRLILITCDPVKVSDAMSGVYSGLFGVVATLKVEFARAITLGCSIGDFLYRAADNYLRPLLVASVPTEYQKWITPLLSYGCKSIGVGVAWSIYRVISAFHSAMRGGDLFARGLSKYLSRQGYSVEIPKGSMVFNGIAMATGAAGFYWQASSYFALPFPINILLLPLRIVEWALVYLVGVN